MLARLFVVVFAAVLFLATSFGTTWCLGAAGSMGAVDGCLGAGVFLPTNLLLLPANLLAAVAGFAMGAG